MKAQINRVTAATLLRVGDNANLVAELTESGELHITLPEDASYISLKTTKNTKRTVEHES